MAINRLGTCKPVIAVFVIMLILVNSFLLYSLVAANSTNNPPSLINTSDKAELGWSQNDLANLTRKDGTIDLIIGVGTQPNSLHEISNIITQYGGNITDTLNMDTIKTVVVSVFAKTAQDVANHLEASGYTRYVELNGTGKLDFAPNDTYWSQQWGLKRICADYAWNTTKGNNTIIVAVLDSGIDYNHPDLQANYVQLGHDWINDDNDPLDDNGHGTACAGIIAATLNNDLGIAGVAQVRIMAEKICDDYGSPSFAAMGQGIIHATDVGANILSCSWATWGDLAVLRDAVNYATTHGVLIVTSAGNTGLNLKQYPAAYDDVVCVAAMDSNDSKASFSSYGDWVDVTAPGVNVYTTLPTYHVRMNDDHGWGPNYSFVNGTSFSCPMAAGVAALIWSRYPNTTAAQVKYQLENTCDDVGTPGFDIDNGFGCINAQKAVETPLPTHDVALKNWQGLQGTARNETGSGLGESKLLSATLTNFGSTTETGVTIQFMINGTVVYAEVIPQLAVAASATINFTWTPTKEGVYNITTYVQPVSGENITLNNVCSVFTSVTYKLALITDGRSSFATVENYRKVFDDIWVTYDLYPDNYFDGKYYTANLTLLQKYKAVIWDKYGYDRDITQEEQTALNAYLESGGNLLVTSQGTVDRGLAEVIRSTEGNLVYASGGLVVVNSTNHIMDGHYGSFHVGYNFTASEIYCANITSDTSRNATLIATMTDGTAKVIATSELPGKVVFWNGGDYSSWSSRADCEAMIQNLVLWFMDDVTPSTTADYNGAWHNSDFTINLQVDDFFGVNQTYYRINGGKTQTVSTDGQPQITQENANNTLEYWSIDYALNQENHHTLKDIKLDKTAPFVLAGPNKAVLLGESITFYGYGVDYTSGVASYSWVFGDGTNGTGASVKHTFEDVGVFDSVVTIKDSAGNKASAVATVAVFSKQNNTSFPSVPTTIIDPTSIPNVTVTPSSAASDDTANWAFDAWVWAALVVVILLVGVFGVFMLMEGKKTSSLTGD